MSTNNTHKQSENGQGLVEYALILSLVALVCVAVLSTLGTAVAGVFEDITCSLSGGDNCNQSCVNEQIAASGTCVGNNLVMNITSNCAGALLSIDGYGGIPPSGNVSIPPGLPGMGSLCSGGVLNPSAQLHIESYHPNGSTHNYTIQPN